MARERDSSQKVAGFLTTVFASANPDDANGTNLMARELLDQGAANIDRSLDSDPAVKETY